jgi:hypothetical protein
LAPYLPDFSALTLLKCGKIFSRTRVRLQENYRQNHAAKKWNDLTWSMRQSIGRELPLRDGNCLTCEHDAVVRQANADYTAPG